MPSRLRPTRRRLALMAAALAVALAAAAPARAGFFAGDVLDGPSAAIVSLGDLDLARDGSGAAVYVKQDGGVDHVFVARLLGGQWQPPERLDPGLASASEAPVVAAGDGGRLAVAFVNAGQLYTILRPAGATSWPAPTPIGSAGAATPSIDMGPNGGAYVVWTEGGADVRAAYLDRLASAFAPLPTPLDIAPAATAGAGTGRPDVAVSADDTAVATWGEAGHVYVRRILGTQLSAVPQDATVTSFNGHAGGAADEPDVDIRDDSSFAWVTFRQAFTDGTRVLARQLRGSGLDDPVDVSGGGFGGEAADAPRVDVNSDGETLFASETTSSNTPFAALVHLDQVGPPVAPAGAQAVAPLPQPAIGENGDGVVAWLSSAGGAPVSVTGRFFHKALPAGDGALSSPDLGPVDPSAGFDAAADRTGNVAVAFVQGSGDQRRLVSGVWDRSPPVFNSDTTSNWRRPLPLKWASALELWGPLTYRVLVDGQQIATTTSTTTPATTVIPEGVHRWRVVAVDRRGQSTTTRLRVLRIDGTPPLIRLHVTGRRVAGNVLHLAARPVDPAPGRRRRRSAGRAAQVQVSGVAFVRFDFGDGSPKVTGSTVAHAFRHGTFTVTITAVDHARNRSTVKVRLRIRA